MNSTRCDLPDSTRQAMVTLLNERLADSIQAGLHAKQAHWNVRGPNFIALHKLFEEVYQALAGFADDLAERATALGGVAEGTLTDVRERTIVAEYPLRTAGGQQHCSALADTLAAFGRAVRAAIDAAAQAHDAGTADLFTEISRQTDKQLWLVEAHLDDGESPERWR